MRLESKDITDENIKKILELFPNVATEAKDENGELRTAIDFDKLKQELLKDVVDGEECYDFTWVGKKEAMVEANRPIRKTLRPDRDSSVDWEDTKNIYIEGDNLEALKLLQESYLGKVKMIYIDPPYNTGKDFVYKDNFTQDKDSYNEELGIKDEDENRLFQNTESNGRFHSDWCSMMYPRLKLARNLLAKDGVIFISIDDNEVENLKKVCNEIFGEGNFLGNITWIKKTKPINSGNAKYQLQSQIDYVLVYCKDKNAENTYVFKLEQQGERKYTYNGKHGLCRLKDILDSDYGSKKRDTMKFPILGVTPPEGNRWKIGEKEVQELLKQDKLIVVDGKIKLEVYPEDEDNFILNPFWSHLKTEIGTSESGKKELNTLMDGNVGFDTVKPTGLITEILKHFEDNIIVLDFFAGTSTTADAIFQANSISGNRKFIMVQIPEVLSANVKEQKDTHDFLISIQKKPILTELGKERIRRAGKKIQEENPAKKIDVGFRVFKVDDTNMKDVYYSPNETNQKQLGLYESNIKDDRTDEDLLYDCLLDWGVELSLPHRVETIDGKRVHIVDEDALIACFEENIPESVVRKIAGMKPLRVVFRDSSFNSDDNKINVEEIFKLITPDTRVKVI